MKKRRILSAGTGAALVAALLFSSPPPAGAKTTDDMGKYSMLPLNVQQGAGVKPLVMLNMSNDHNLFFKAYDDVFDLDGDNVPDTTYKHSIDYYGYFDSFKCYKYNPTYTGPDGYAGRFEPVGYSASKYCNLTAAISAETVNSCKATMAADKTSDAVAREAAYQTCLLKDATYKQPFSSNTPTYQNWNSDDAQWSGNFLNWATMSRMDVVRKILFGGARSEDGSATNGTTLERTVLPKDAHSWAKHYDGADLKHLTPFRPMSSATENFDNYTGGPRYVCDASNPEVCGIRSTTVPYTGKPGDGSLRATDGAKQTLLAKQGEMKSSWTQEQFQAWADARFTAATGLDWRSWKAAGTYRPNNRTFVWFGDKDEMKKPATEWDAQGWRTFIEYINWTNSNGHYLIVVLDENVELVKNTAMPADMKKEITRDFVMGQWAYAVWNDNLPEKELLPESALVTNLAPPAPCPGLADTDHCVQFLRGMTFGNTTELDSTQENWRTQHVTLPPVLKTVFGNFSQWGEMQNQQLAWDEGTGVDSIGDTDGAGGSVTGKLTPYRKIWNDEARSNGNLPEYSGVYASPQAPSWSEHLGLGQYVVRVQACAEAFVDEDAMSADTKTALVEAMKVSGWTRENCKQYPQKAPSTATASSSGGSTGDGKGAWQPVGLLQEFGDTEQLYFGMTARSLANHAKGGTLMKEIAKGMKDEIDVDGNGSFISMAKKTGTGQTGAWTNGSGMINALSRYRIVAYAGKAYADCIADIRRGSDWYLKDYTFDSSYNNCKAWGNPMAEMYLQSLHYLANRGRIETYMKNGAAWTKDNDIIYGLPDNPQSTTAADPLDLQKDNSGNKITCVPMNIINISSSDLSWDADDIDQTSISNIWGSVTGAATVKAMTDEVGEAAGLNNNDFFYGRDGDETDEYCSAKTLTSLGDVRGVCPGVPRLKGSYSIAGLSYYAQKHNIRPDFGDGEKQTVKTYSVAMASGSPVFQIPDPEGGATNLTIIPACVVQSANTERETRCSLVGYRIIDQNVNPTAKTAGARIYVSWDELEAGGDFDSDTWGVLEYEYNKSTQKVTVSTQIFYQGVGFQGAGGAYSKMGFGYVINGTTEDGFHAHTGLNGYKNDDDADAAGSNCHQSWMKKADGTGGLKYTTDYAANSSAARSTKFGDDDWRFEDKGCWCGFRGGAAPPAKDKDSWSGGANSVGYCNTSSSGLDGAGKSSKTYTVGTSKAVTLSDPLEYAAVYGGGSYHKTNDPAKLEEALRAVFANIMTESASGTAAALTPANIRGEGAVYQAGYTPKAGAGETETRWTGSLQSLWMDSAGHTREDCGGKADGTSYTAAEITANFTDGNGKCQLSANFACYPNGRLDNYCVDRVVEIKYDAKTKKTMAHVKNSDQADSFKSPSMQGMVTAVNGNSVTLSPYVMEGQVSSAAYDGEKTILAMTSYRMTATVTTWSETSGTATLRVSDLENCPSNASASNWTVTLADGGGSGAVAGSLGCTAGAHIVTINASGELLDALNQVEFGIGATHPTVILESSGAVGPEGQTLDNWQVTCLAGGSGSGASESNVRLSGSGSAQEIEVEGDFSTCEAIRLVSYDVSVDPVNYEEWEVHNLDNLVLGEGKGNIRLANDEYNRSLTVSSDNAPTTADWISAGDRLLLTNQSVSIVEKDSINAIWSAEKGLYLQGVSDDALKTNRTWGTSAATGRYIMTWVDENNDGKVGVGEFRALEEGIADADRWQYLDVNDADEAKAVINWARGVESSTQRNRTDADGNVQRLGDIIDSSPTVVSAPMENYDFLYKDYMEENSYRKFRAKWLNRRIVVYAGANDGMLHAFNGGFYHCLDKDLNQCVSGSEPKYVSYKTNNRKGDAVEHPLGAELWAYAPGAALPHLRWLADKNYGSPYHVYYVNGVPRAFDADIFTPDEDHIGGWGTVLVVGMDRGGPAIDVTATIGSQATTVTKTSTFLVFDITNPEKAPVLLGEIPMPDGSFTTVYPAAASFAKGTDTKHRNWYLIFGNGPKAFGANASSATTTENASIFLFDLGQLTGNPYNPDGGAANHLPKVAGVAGALDTDCERKSLLGGVPEVDGGHEILICASDQANSFIGAPTVVDWNLDFTSNAAYIGSVGGQEFQSTTTTDSAGLTTTEASGFSGAVLKMDFGDSSARDSWTLRTFYETKRPVTVQPMVGLDNLNNCWIYFGTGRQISIGDMSAYYDNYLYGIKDGYLEDGDCNGKAANYTKQRLVDVSYTDVFTDGTLYKSETAADDPGPYFTVGDEWKSANGLMLTLENDATGYGVYGDVDADADGLSKMTTFDELRDYIDEDKASGWRRYLPYILNGCKDTQDDECYTPSTRSLTRPTLAGGVVFYTVYEPSSEPCEGLGKGRLYGLNYKTGTANPDPILGVRVVTRTEFVDEENTTGRKTLSMAYYEPAGLGMPSSPSVTVDPEGNATVEFQNADQSSEKVKANLELELKPGRISWEEVVDE